MAIFGAILAILIEIVLWVTKISWAVTEKTAKVTYNVASKVVPTASKTTGKVALKTATRTGKFAVRTTGKVAVGATKLGLKPIDNKLNQVKGYKSLKKGAKFAEKSTKFAFKTLKFTAKTTVKFVKLVFFILRVIFFILLAFFSAMSMFEFMFVVVVPAAAAGGIVALVSSDKVATNSGNKIKSKSKGASKSSSSKSKGNLKESLESISKWYIKNVRTYQFSPKGVRGTGSVKMYKCPLEPAGTAGDDCSSFACVFMSMVCGTHIPRTYSGTFCSESSFSGTGWKFHKCSDLKSVDELEYGDILACNGSLGKGSGHHCEVYIDSGHTFGWGSIKDKYPTDSAVSLVGGFVRDSGHSYYAYWRYEGK